MWFLYEYTDTHKDDLLTGRCFHGRRVEERKKGAMGFKESCYQCLGNMISWADINACLVSNCSSTYSDHTFQQAGLGAFFVREELWKERTASQEKFHNEGILKKGDTKSSRYSLFLSFKQLPAFTGAPTRQEKPSACSTAIKSSSPLYGYLPPHNRSSFVITPPSVSRTTEQEVIR